jgi:rod shape-determining protein MreC
VNKGMRDGVHANQAAVDGNGIIGQVASVGPWSSEIILLSDPQLAVPVQIERNQLRTIAVGSGDPDKILLQYLAVNADVKSGDKLLSSGLGGVYPTGFPVGTVIGVVRAENQLLAQVVASPAARITSLHEVALLDFNAANPAAPAAVAAPGIAAGKPAASAPPAKAP